MYTPVLQQQQQAHSQSFDVNTVPSSTGLQCSSVQYTVDAQLAGALVPFAGGAPMIGSSEKKKRGRPPRSQVAVKPPPLKRLREEDEDVCFICFDGGSLVLCDRKGCPKAYHPACIKRDEAFFRSKAKWNCGWHICSVCQKASHYLCYTCTYSLCKACTKNADYLCVRGNKGFCSTCMKTIMLIENKDQANKEMVQVDFDDKTSWEYLFKVYWVILKEKLSLTLDELVQAKNPWKELDATYGKRQLMSYSHCLANDGKGIASKPFYHSELTKPIDPPELCKENPQNRALAEFNNVSILSYTLQSELPKTDPPTTENQKIVESNSMSILSSTPHSELSKMDPPTTENRTIAESNIILSSTQSELTKPVEELELQNKDCSRKKQGSTDVETSVNGHMEWASKELLDFVAHMKDGDTSAISQFDVQALLLDYIKRNNLRDPRRKSQIICDLRLKSLFGKPRVGHIEMLKLLEFHFLIKEESKKSTFIPAGIVGTVAGHVEPNGNHDFSPLMNNARKRKTPKNGEVKMAQINLDEYAAIDAHNIKFIYLRRDLMENLAEDVKHFPDRVIGSVVRIRIPGNDQKQEIYRLVHVVGTCKSSEPYKIRDKTVDVLLEVLNLDKKEAISIDSISNQDFCEDECRRLRQSIKCGLMKRLTVGEIRKKAMELCAVKLNDSLEAEVLRLNHLRDRASEKGHKKELRECIEKLELLKTPGERQRRLLEIPEVHADPKMDPSYGSEGDDRDSNDKRKVEYPAPRCTRIRRGEKLSPSGILVKEEGSTMARCRMSDKSEARGTNILDKLGNRLTADQAVDRSGSETSVASLSTANSSSSNSSETEKMWHYRDPAGRIQGPFCVIQLRKWNMSGLFPPDMRIWTNHEHDDSVLLIDALTGLYHKAPSQLHHKTSSQSQKTASSNSRNSGRLSETATGSWDECGKREAPGHHYIANNHSNANTQFTRMNGLSPSFPKCLDLSKGNNSSAGKPRPSNPAPFPSQREVVLALPRQERGHENDNYRSIADHVTQNSSGSTVCQKDGYGRNTQSNGWNSGHSSLQNQGSFTSNRCSVKLDSGSTFGSATKSSDSFEQKGQVSFPDLPSPTPETSYGELEAEAAEKLLLLSSVIPVCGSDIHDLPSPTPTSNHEAQGGHVAEKKESPVHGSGHRWNNAHHGDEGGHADENKESPDRESGHRLSNANHEAQFGHAAENKESVVQESGHRLSNANHEAQVGHSSENKESPVQESGHRWSTANHEAPGGRHAAENKESVPSNLPPVQESGPSNANHEAQVGHSAENKESPVQESGHRWTAANHEAPGGGHAAENKETAPSNLPPVQESGHSNTNHEAQGRDAAKNKESVPSDLPPVEELGPSNTNHEAQGGHAVENNESVLSGLLQESCPRWNNANHEAQGHAAESKESLPSSLPVQESGPRWSNLVIGGAPTEEWDPGFLSISSLKPADAVGDHVAAPTLNADQLNHTSPSHPLFDFFSEPIEFSTLAEESVSDLLAEVDAMESQNQNGMGSPTSAMRCGQEIIPGCRNTDCFSPIEELSPAHDPVKSDTLTSTGDLQLPCQSTVTDETVLASQADGFDPLRRSGGNSSTSSEGETKSADVLFSRGETRSNIPATCTTSQTTSFSAMGRSAGFEGMTSGRGTEPVNPNWGGTVQGYANVGYGGNMGAPWGNSHMNRGTHSNGNPMWDSQRRYTVERSGGPRDWALQGGDSGYGRGRSPWNNRQQPYGGGGYSRPPPRGQRICKFYESGRCKKGSSCGYLHP